MASKIIGRAKCPECSFESAHVKESEKCLYRYCPNCGINGPHARTPLQRENMTKGMRPVEAPAPTPTQPSPTPRGEQVAGEPMPTPTPTGKADPTPTPTPTPRKARGLFF